MSGHAKMPPASHQVSATSLKRLIKQIHPHVRIEHDSGMCVAQGCEGGERKGVGGCRWPSPVFVSKAPFNVSFVRELATVFGHISCETRGALQRRVPFSLYFPTIFLFDHFPTIFTMISSYRLTLTSSSLFYGANIFGC